MMKKLAVFIHFCSFFEAIQLFLSPIFLSLFIEMPFFNINKRVACLKCGREYTRKDASRHHKHCVVLVFVLIVTLNLQQRGTHLSFQEKRSILLFNLYLNMYSATSNYTPR